MGGGLVRDGVDLDLAGQVPAQQLGHHVRGVALQADRQRPPLGLRGARPGDGVVEVRGDDVEVAVLQPARDAGGVALDADRDAVVHGDGERLGATHAAQPRGQGDGPGERAAEPLAGNSAERLVRALQDPLGADVDPRAGGHLAVHHEALALQLAEVLPRGPIPHEVGVRDQHPRRPLVGAEYPDGLAGLDEQGLVVGEGGERGDDGVEGLPAAGGAAGPAVHHELVGVLGHLRIEVVHEHAQRRLLRPAAGSEFEPAWGADGPGAVRRGHRRSLLAGTHPPHPIVSLRGPLVQRWDIMAK